MVLSSLPDEKRELNAILSKAISAENMLLGYVNGQGVKEKITLIG